VRTVTVTAFDGTTVDLEARCAVVVSTGSDPLIPPIPGLAEASPWTSRNATGASAIPARLAVLGDGVVACEMATAYSSLGSQVTMLARSGLLGRMEPFAGELVAGALRSRGVDVRCGAQAVAVSRDGGPVTVALADGGSVVADEILVATGRSPRTRDLGLAAVGLDDGSWLPVDDTLLVDAPTNAAEPWLYAVGDVNHRALLTHEGKYQGRAAGRVIAARAAGERLETEPWGRHVATADHRSVPQVTFTDPEVASVGLTEAAARKAGLAVRTVEADLGSVSGAAIYSDDYEGRAKLVIDDERDVVLGATFVGQGIGELLQSATVAVVGEVPLQRLWHAVPSYPTLSEIWLRLLEADGRA
jgi:pyruvate/2-oxoglutarate dehydrogenase complex dihydrolipoamide dehydrogenase (E3) component